MKRKLSSNDKDNGLIRTVEKIRPFFESLDKRPIHKGDRKQIISDYRTLLANGLLDFRIEDMVLITVRLNAVEHVLARLDS